MIKSFKCKETERLFNRQPTRRIPANLHRWALRKLWILAAAEKLEDLRSSPGNRLENLEGDRKGQCSIRINDQFRICFVWQDNNAYEVEIADYH
ncbi:MAG: type II toxin-antitoxin system RelE/ParE family toxin [Desulfobaccales bacterium]